MNTTIRLCAALSTVLACLPGLAQDFPNHPVKLIVPTAAAGPVDVVGRVIANELSLIWKQPVIVENRPGGSATIGTHAVATAAPDGYTLLAAFPPNVANPALFKKLPYDAKLDFAPVAKMVELASVLLVQPSFPANNLKEFVEYVRARPGKVSWAIGSIGATEHLAGGMLASRAQLQFLPVPYQGAGPALRDLLGGQVDFKIESVGNALPHLKAGKLKAITVTTETRSSLLPDVPSIAEGGYPGAGLTAWIGIMAPAAVPPEIVNKIAADTAAILKRPDVVQKLLAVGATVDSQGPADFKRFTFTQMGQYDALIREMGLHGSN